MLSIRRWLLATLCLMSLCGLAGAQTPAGPVLDQLGWLAGNWQGDGELAELAEHYSPVAGGTLMGTSRVVHDGKAVHTEFLFFEERSDGVFLTEWFPGRQTIRFKLARVSADRWEFETVDRPTLDRLSYERVGDDRLRITLVKDVNGSPQTMIFPMRRKPVR